MVIQIALILTMIMMVITIQIDAFPFDSSEWIDTDLDGVGDNSDNDFNGDGLVDDKLFPTEFISPNGDGINDSWVIVNAEFSQIVRFGYILEWDNLFITQKDIIMIGPVYITVNHCQSHLMLFN